MTNPDWDRARARYQETPIPPELPFTVASALRRGGRQRTGGKALRRSLAGLAAACACFVLLVNTSPAFAAAVAEVPVLGSLARICTVAEFSRHDDTKLLDVRLPALERTGYADLEQRINTEITSRIDRILADAETRAGADRKAFLDTGGKVEDFIPVMITVDYEIKCQSDQYLSFVLSSTETQANAYAQLYTYNIDLETGTELTLRDLLGPNWKDICNTAVTDGMAQRTAQDPMNSYFDGGEGVSGFTSVTEDQKFYLDASGTPVLLFEKYTIAPGYMGIQEFPVATSTQP